MADDSVSVDQFNPFKSTSDFDASITLNIHSCNRISVPIGTCQLIENLKWVSQKSNLGINWSVYDIREDQKKIINLLQINHNWTKASISLLKGYYSKKLFLPFIGVFFRYALLFHHGLLIHASSLKWDEKGIVFSAPTETGKTTQANLWKKYMGASIINDDHTALRVEKEYTQVYGVPWCKPSATINNDNAPVKAIILLEQDSNNSLQKLNYNEIIQKLLPRCFLPYFSEDLMKIALDNFYRIILTTPVYLLKCKPNREAVDLVYQCVK